MMRIETTGLVTALLLVASQPALGQMHSRMHDQQGDTVPSMQMARGMMMGGMMGQGMMGSGMMPMMHQGMGMMATGGPSPTALLYMQDDLELTDRQVTALEAIRDDAQAQMQGRMSAMMSAHGAAADALEGASPDLDSYEGNLRTAADLMVQSHLAMARSALEARDVLTPEQREMLDARGIEMIRGMMMHGGPGGR